MYLPTQFIFLPFSYQTDRSICIEVARAFRRYFSQYFSTFPWSPHQKTLDMVAEVVLKNYHRDMSAWSIYTYNSLIDIFILNHTKYKIFEEQMGEMEIVIKDPIPTVFRKSTWSALMKLLKWNNEMSIYIPNLYLKFESLLLLLYKRRDQEHGKALLKKCCLHCPPIHPLSNPHPHPDPSSHPLAATGWLVGWLAGWLPEKLWY